MQYASGRSFYDFFSMLSDIEKYFALVKVGCSDVRLSMTYQQIAMDELFVFIVEADKKLQTLKDTLRMSDITGDCGIAFFMDQWERLLRKYK